MPNLLSSSEQEFLEMTNVSRETLEHYQTWYNLLSRWNNKINLVSPATINNYWLRHALDSQQLCALAPLGTKQWLDLGSGAGFPGLAAAIGFKALKQEDIQQVTLVEAYGKKCNFLRAVIRELKLPAKALQERVENITPNIYDVISARAFAPLPKLLEYSSRFWGEDTLGIFPKGRSWQEEVNTAEQDWIFTLETKDSKTDPEAKILMVTGLKKRDKGQHVKTMNNGQGDV